MFNFHLQFNKSKTLVISNRIFIVIEENDKNTEEYTKITLSILVYIIVNIYFHTVLYTCIADFSSKQINPLAFRASLVCRSNLYLIEFYTYISYFYLFSFNLIH